MVSSRLYLAILLTSIAVYIYVGMTSQRMLWMCANQTVQEDATFLRQEQSSTNASIAAPPVQRHVMFALSGNETGFIAEFEVSLKSVLLNGPLEDPLTIHILADADACKAIGPIFEKANFKQWKSRDPVTIRTYNVQAHEASWLAKIHSRMARAENFTDTLFRHTVGAYYRLFCAHVLPKSVDTVLYLDTDAIVLSSLDDIWNHYLNDTKMFQWGGASRCSGFMVLRPQDMETVWKIWSDVPTEMLHKMLKRRPVADDQLVLRAVAQLFPDHVGHLPAHWDVSASDGPWRDKPNQLIKYRPAVSMMHYNGGGTNNEAFWKVHPFYASEHWALTRYYVDMPWSWAQQQLKGRIRRDHAGYELALEYA